MSRPLPASLPEISSQPVPPPYPTGGGRFGPGMVVRIKRGRAPGHVRTPWYLRGKRGRVERLCGDFANPESLAYHGNGLPAQPLYRVRFTMAELWGDEAERPSDTLDVEIYEHWLEADDAA
ncbi:MAG: SH3-like domain-containing protein [Pseudomonadota bacterium]